jgi:FkbM family methyltransferase
MNFSKFELGKLKWLASHEVVRRHPVRTIGRLVAWEIARLSNRPLSMTYDGCYHVDLYPNEGASRLTYYFGVSEPELFEFYNSFLRPGMVVIDAGANIGLHTLSFAKRVGPTGFVYAFEPGRASFKRLRGLVDQNGLTNVSCFNCALGAAVGNAAFTENQGDTSRSFVTKAPVSVDGEYVPVRSLDEVFKDDRTKKVDFAKIDVEGFEEQVLLGATEALNKQSISVIQLELDNRSLARNSSSASNIVRLLAENGYQRAEWDREKMRFCPATQQCFNSFFIADHLRAWTNES